MKTRKTVISPPAGQRVPTPADRLLLARPGWNSFLCLDPKTEVAAIVVPKKRRRRKANAVTILNPYGLLSDKDTSS